MALIMLVIALLTILFIRCRHSRNAIKNNSEKDFPPPLPRPPDFMGLNNNRIYSSSDGSQTASSTPLPVLSSIPHCKVTPIEFEDSESDDIGDLNVGDNQQMARHLYPYGDDNDEWSSSCDIGNEVNYSTIAQPQQGQQQRMNNPLLRRNQYWV
ncbi:hypothetical protein HA402_012813 [Bradysia odoriphaga]|nr:hypothetical protein HA402_012813 [Bradysia odoriphaga]